MTKMGASGCAVALGILLGATGMVQAEETGMAGIHSWVRVGGKTCLLDHFHDGSGKGPTRTAAERQAIQAWVDFTAFEYGGSWGRYSIAASKRMTCSRSESWSCAVEARPCRSR